MMMMAMMLVTDRQQSTFLKCRQTLASPPLPFSNHIITSLLLKYCLGTNIFGQVLCCVTFTVDMSSTVRWQIRLEKMQISVQILKMAAMSALLYLHSYIHAWYCYVYLSSVANIIGRQDDGTYAEDGINGSLCLQLSAQQQQRQHEHRLAAHSKSTPVGNGLRHEQWQQTRHLILSTLDLSKQARSALRRLS